MGEGNRLNNPPLKTFRARRELGNCRANSLALKLKKKRKNKTGEALEEKGFRGDSISLFVNPAILILHLTRRVMGVPKPHI